MDAPRTHAAVGFLLVAAWAAGVSAASAATLNVTVRDKDGVIPGALVRLSAGEADQGRRLLSNQQGVAHFTSLQAGRYELRASFPGFTDAVVPALALADDETRSLELTLAIAAVSATLTVETANRHEQLLLDVAAPVTLLERSQIEDAGARSARDVLIEQSGAGIQVNAGGGQGHLSINGIPNKGVLVLVNGRRYLGKDANGNLNLEELRLPGLERIEVVKGAGSALYGSDALGGVVNFITSRPADRGVTNSLAVSGGSHADYRVDDSFSWRGARGGAALAGGYRTYDGFDLEACTGAAATSGACRPNPQTIGQPPSTYWSASGTGDLEIGRRLVARFFGDYQLREVRGYYFSGATQLASTVYDSQRDLTRYLLSPELDLVLSPRTSFNLVYNHGRYERDETRVFSADGRIVPQAPWRERNQEAKLTARHSWPAFGRQHLLQGGYEFRRESLSRGSLAATEPDNPLGVADKERDIQVAWAQQELNLARRLSLSLGVRYDDYADFGSEWSPKAEAVVTLSERQRLRGSYGHGFRPPYFGELFLYTPPFFVGNADLVPEKSNGFTAGYTFSSGSAQVSLDGYHTQIRDGIVFFQLTPSSFTYRNLDRYNSRGANLAVSLTLPFGLSPSLSYAYNERETPEGAEVGGYPHHSLFVKLLWANPRLGLRANVRGQFNGRVPPGTDGTFQPAYQVWSAQLRKRVTGLGAHSLTAYAQVDNLFDEGDVFLANADGTPVQGQFQVWLAPRTFQAGLTIDLDFTH